jgi:hypothetical protein
MDVHCEQLRADPLNEYAAFDFFVAAAHLPEWLRRFRCSHNIKGAEPVAIHAVCLQLAKGAKHFVPKGHNSLRGTGVSTPARSGIARSEITFAGATQPKLIILLADDEAAALGVPVISALSLASQLLAYWKEHEGVRRAATRIKSDRTSIDRQ